MDETEEDCVGDVPLQQPNIKHVDEFIEQCVYGEEPKDAGLGDVKYAVWKLMQFRWAAVYKYYFEKYINDTKLFCTYEGQRYRCTGASRLGDVWLTSNFDQDTGYEKRVDLAKCTLWSDQP